MDRVGLKIYEKIMFCNFQIFSVPLPVKKGGTKKICNYLNSRILICRVLQVPLPLAYHQSKIAG